MKLFKVYELRNKYVVLKCPHCEFIYRDEVTENYNPNKSRCRRCGKKFDWEKHQIGKDPLLNIWDREIVFISPEGKEELRYPHEKDMSVTIISGEDYNAVTEAYLKDSKN